jgi:choline-glycine betaine transporter
MEVMIEVQERMTERFIFRLYHNLPLMSMEFFITLQFSPYFICNYQNSCVMVLLSPQKKDPEAFAPGHSVRIAGEYLE